MPRRWKDWEARRKQRKLQRKADTNSKLHRDAVSPQEDSQDLWQLAYKELKEEDRDTVSTLDEANKNTLNDINKSSQGSEAKGAKVDAPEYKINLVNEVIEVTKRNYGEYRRRSWRFQGESTGRKIASEFALKIFNSAISFNDVISAGASLDPTQHAAFAWNLVSLGLKVSQLHQLW